MSIVPLSSARVSLQLQGSMLLGTIENNQSQLLTVQNQLSSGNQLSQASDNPAAALGIISLKQQISDNTSYTANLGFVSGFLGQADSSLQSLSTLINQAQSIASSQVGVGSTPDQRAAQAQVVDSLLSQALDIANTQSQGQAVFGGQNGIDNPFVALGGGYKYQGTTTQQGILTPAGGTIDYTISGDQAFGALSSQVTGATNLAPALTATTRLADLNGATGKGVTPGPINVTVGPTTVSVDLSQAATAGDVVADINAALSSASSDASVSLSGGSLAIAGDSTQSITIADTQSGTTALDLGIAGTIPAAGSVTGISLSPRITNTTPLASLNNGTGIDPAGIIITNGTNTATVTLGGLTTVEDLINAINASGTNVQAQINAAGTGINVLNPLSGTSLTIGENGGNTASELGIRSFNAQTELADLNNATGVTPIANTATGPTGQVIVTGTNGTQFTFQADGITTPSQLIAAINSATGNTTVTATPNATGNGITLTDTSGGGGNLVVTGGSNFASNGSTLGIFQTGAGGTLTGSNITFSTDDFRISRRDGSSFTVDLKGANTIQDVLNRINSADGNTNPATQVTASLNPTGNGIQLSDASAGSASLTVTALNNSNAAAQLGLNTPATSAAPGVIAGGDVNPQQSKGLFSSLTMLRDALLNNDTAGITQAGVLLQQDSAQVAKANGIVGAREQDVAARKNDVSSEQTQLQSALSLLSDTDFTAAATRFQQLQTSYQAGLQVAQTASNLSLLDFLK